MADKSRRLEVMGTRENKAHEGNTRDDMKRFSLVFPLPINCYPRNPPPPPPQRSFSQATNVAITLTFIDSKENHVYENSY